MRALATGLLACLIALPAFAEAGVADTNIAGHWTFEANIAEECEFGGQAYLEKTGEDRFQGEVTARQSCIGLEEDYLVRQECAASQLGNQLSRSALDSLQAELQQRLQLLTHIYDARPLPSSGPSVGLGFAGDDAAFRAVCAGLILRGLQQSSRATGLQLALSVLPAKPEQFDFNGNEDTKVISTEAGSVTFNDGDGGLILADGAQNRSYQVRLKLITTECSAGQEFGYDVIYGFSLCRPESRQKTRLATVGAPAKSGTKMQR